MGDRGPQPKFTPEQAALLGNPGNRALPVVQDGDAPLDNPFPDILIDVPSPPDWLGGAKGPVGVYALTAWGELAPLLVASRQMREGDQIALARYCRYVGEWVQMTAEIDDMGMIVMDEGPKGGVTTKANPLLRARSSVETAISALEKELGLAPKARIDVQKRLMQHAKDLPLLGSNRKSDVTRGPIGALTGEKDDE